jgi:hypothetical protein
MKSCSKVIVQLAVLLMTTQCGGVSPVAPVSPIPTPAPTQVALTTPQALAPTPLPDKGVVIGTVLTWGTDKPVANTQVYLAELTNADEEGDLTVAAVYFGTSPYAETDPMGKLLFVDVEPGTYGLALWSPTGSTLVKDVSGEKDLVFTVSAGQVMDLGITYGPAGF